MTTMALAILFMNVMEIIQKFDDYGAEDFFFMNMNVMEIVQIYV